MSEEEIAAADKAKADEAKADEVKGDESKAAESAAQSNDNLSDFEKAVGISNEDLQKQLDQLGQQIAAQGAAAQQAAANNGG